MHISPNHETPPRSTAASAGTSPAAPSRGRHSIWLGWVYILLELPLGALWLALLIGGWALTIVTSWLPLGPFVLVGLDQATHLACRLEALLARDLLGINVMLEQPKYPRAGIWKRSGAILRSGRFWRQQRFLVFDAIVLKPVWIAAGVGFPAVAWFSAWAPFHPSASPPPLIEYAQNHNNSPYIGFGVCAIVLMLPAVRLACWLAGHNARAMGMPTTATLATEAAARISAARMRTGVLIHSAINGLVALLLVVIWAITRNSGVHVFWPIWPILPLATTAGIHASLAEIILYARRKPLPVATSAIAIHATLAAWIEALLIGLWAAGPHPMTFWPVWPLLGLAFTTFVHLVLWVPRRRTEGNLAARMGELEETRAGALDAHASELRRIERDLHDGAQARIVALGMAIGRAEQHLDSDPDAARTLLGEARSNATSALAELRQLARGIAPPLLVDRGLDAAVRSLVDTSTMTIELTIDPRISAAHRLPPAVETAAYFVISEALTNAAKHAPEAHVHITIEQSAVRSTVVLAVRDDGAGGADPGGTGLTGLRQRVAALDGSFSVDSPAGGPTTIYAELPCAS